MFMHLYFVYVYLYDVCMDGWIDGCLDGWMYGWNVTVKIKYANTVHIYCAELLGK